MLSSLVSLVLLPYVGALVALLFRANARNIEAILAGTIALNCVVQAIRLFPMITQGQVIQEVIPWAPSLGLNMVFRMDGYSWLFCILIFGIGALVALYARYYMSAQDPVPRFFSFFLAFMGSMAGVVLSGNMIQMVLFWELTSVFSFLLIGYWHHRRDARRGARMALTVTGFGGLCLLGGVLILGHIVGSYDLDDILASGDIIRNHRLYLPLLCLILLGAFTKSAQFPFHFWLPRAMAAPTPVSAYLHSATMVKAGIYLLSRLWPVLSGTPEWFTIVSCVGAATLLIGGYIAMFQNDLKAVLAYSTISHLGLIVLLLGMNSTTAAVAAVFHTINHAIFKASLFMGAGIIDHETGTRDMRRLSGLIKAMPITGTLCFVAGAAMAGVPLLNGFLSKEMFFAQTIELQSTTFLSWALPFLATISSVFSIAYSLRFTVDVFLGKPAVGLPKEPHEPTRWMRVPIEFLVALCLIIGIIPSIAISSILASAATPVVGGDLPSYSLAIWHGFNTPIIMSCVAMIGGIYFYLILRRQIRLGVFAGVPFISWLNGASIYNWVLTSTTRVGIVLSRALSTKRLQTQIATMLVVVILAGVMPLWEFGQGLQLDVGVSSSQDVSILFILVWIAGIACAFGAAWQAKFHRLSSLIFLGMTGLITCLTFVWLSAPDLALTQLTVEIVTVVLILLGLRWLPKPILNPSHESSWLIRARRTRDLIIAGLAGTGISILAYAMMTHPVLNPKVAQFYLQHAQPEGGGTNVVNVMLVDFRSFDTMGEIVVLGIVALTVYALLRRFRPAKESTYIPSQQTTAPADISSDVGNPVQAKDTALGYLMIPAVLARLVLPIAMVLSVYFFLRGHNQPGGGFVAGLVFSSAFVVQYMIAGTQWAEARMRLMPQKLISLGWLIALLTGAGAIVAGYPFLTTHTAHVTLPVLGELHFPSAAAFDLGVFILVVGSTILILTALAHQSVRGRRARETEVEERIARDAEEEEQPAIQDEDMQPIPAQERTPHIPLTPAKGGI